MAMAAGLAAPTPRPRAHRPPRAATATIQVRERSCPAGECGDWGEGFDWVISYLTWSGGVTTAYKDFQGDMQLVVFDDQGRSRLSL